MQYLKLFYNNVEVTEEKPLKVGPLNASDNEESDAMAVTLKVEEGFSTFGDTTVSFEGTTAEKWSVCATESGDYASTLTLSEVVSSAGVTFYVKAKATEEEQPSNDISVKVKVAATIQAA